MALIAIPLFFMVVPSPDDWDKPTPAEKQARHEKRDKKVHKMYFKNFPSANRCAEGESTNREER